MVLLLLFIIMMIYETLLHGLHQSLRVKILLHKLFTYENKTEII